METTTHQRTITRTTHLIRKPFAAVLSRLSSSLVQPGADLRSILSPSALSSRADHESAVRACLGPHGFMEMFRIQHGNWMPLFGVQQKATRIVFGNPLIAITMLRHNVRAGLFVPVEVLLVEREEGVTEVVQDLPSSLIAGNGEEEGELRKAAEVLDRKLAVLWEWVGGEEELPAKLA